MATRINMMKLLQEVRGLAEITGRRPYSRPPGPLMLHLREPVRKLAAFRRKRLIRVDMQTLPDIPNPVRITHVQPGALPPA